VRNPSKPNKVRAQSILSITHTAMQKSDEDVLKEKIALATNIALCAAIMVEFGAVSREEADQIIQDLFTSQKLARPTLDAEGLLEFEPQDVNRAQLTRIHKALKQDGRYVIAVQAKESADRERADQERERQKAADLAAANTQAEEEARRCQERARQRNPSCICAASTPRCARQQRAGCSRQW